MNKNDKLIVLLGVIILIVASLGVYIWKPQTATGSYSTINEFFYITGSYSKVPDAIVASDTNPFYTLIATPLAVHYDTEGNQEIIPLYVENISSPSDAITRVINDQIEIPINLYIDSQKSVEQWSIDIANTYWGSSDAALLIENSQEGYILGVMATPIASYLSIPIYVTNEINSSLQESFKNLGIVKTIVCGSNLPGYGDVLRFTTIDEVENATAMIVKGKFDTINYISITNPQDAWPPEVLANTSFTLGPVTMRTSATTELIPTLTGLLKGNNVVGTFTIPDDYKYALVKFKGINLNIENVDDLGDNVLFTCGPMLKDIPSGLQTFEIEAGGTNAGGIPVRDSNGHIIEDICYTEAVVYDRGGVTYQVTASPMWLASKEGQVKAEVVVEKLSNPRYPSMKSFSSIAPYLTAYHKGLVFGRPSYAYAADDDVLYLGKPSPGFYSPRRNPTLTGAFNDHIYDIHEDINHLLANISGITLKQDLDIKNLKEYYTNNPVYITLIGDGTMIPQYIYDSAIDVISPPEDVSYYFGGGVPSDFIYGDIDPNPRDWSSQAPDLYSDYPYQENIVGRITGWDIQDASALIDRTIFYDAIVGKMGDWKNTAAVQLGGGNDFQKPFLRYLIFGDILKMIKRGEPMKVDTGASYFNGLTLQKKVESLGFTTQYVRENAATLQGFSQEAIMKLKKANVLNRLLLSPRQLEKAVGADNVIGKQVQEESNFILANAHGNQHMFGMGDVGMYKLGLGLPNGILERIIKNLVPIIGYGPGLSLSDHGYYSTRNVENLNLGPSFIFIESCICGKIDGMYPKQGISQAYLHAGVNTVIASTTSSNIAGGYLEPKRTKYDFPGQTLYRYLLTSMNVKRGIYPDLHFGFKIYSDLCDELNTNGTSIGLAFRNARNQYLPEDATWKVWWSPPLVLTGNWNFDLQNYKNAAEKSSSGPNEQLDNKYMSFFEYTIYGDPAFIPYVPNVTS